MDGSWEWEHYKGNQKKTAEREEDWWGRGSEVRALTMLRPESESPSHLSKWHCMIPLPILKCPLKGFLSEYWQGAGSCQ